METLKKFTFISPSFFTIIVISFFMSFFTLQCSDKKIMTINGNDFVFGKEFKMQDPMSGKVKTQKIPPSIWAIIPFALSVIGIGIFFINTNLKFVIAVVLSIVSIISLIILKNNLNSEIEGQGGGMVSIELVPQIGYYISMIGLIMAGVFNLTLFIKANQVTEE